MKLSYNWLQTYFKQPLPSVEDLEREISLHAFEHEETKVTENGDTMIEFDVLPNRAADCLSHYGLAREIALHFAREDFIDDWRDRVGAEVVEQEEAVAADATLPLNVKAHDYDRASYYMGRVMQGITVTDSPAWMKTRLETIGQRSINAIVDATNYVQFELGQPLHAFDYDKLAKGEDGTPTIHVRLAAEGETMTTLDNNDLTFCGDELVIADDEKILALAGVKGGKAAEVDENTTNIVLECAHFDALSTRKTARRLNILTDASKRYENNLSPFVGGEAMQMLSELITMTSSTDSTLAGEYLRDRDPDFIEKYSPKSVAVPLSQIQKLLGAEIPTEQITNILEAIMGDVELADDVYTAEPTLRRRDLLIPEDVIEEVGRIYGYGNLPETNLDDIEFTPKTLEIATLEQHMRNFFVERGYSELMGYTFEKKGDLYVAKAMASDKAALRKDLTTQAQKSMEQNLYYAPVYNREVIRTFELNRVYPEGIESRHCVISVGLTSKKARKKFGNAALQINGIITEFNTKFGTAIPQISENDSHAEFRYDVIADPKVIDDAESIYQTTSEITLGDVLGRYNAGATDIDVFQPYSTYPFTTRDIALWVDATTTESDIESLLEKEAGELALRIDQFDRFEKEGRVSYGYRIVFQSMEKTLSDEDVAPAMTAITAACESNGWEVR